MSACGVDAQHVLAMAAEELQEDIRYAEEGHREVRLQREKGRDEKPAKERYEEVLRAKRAYQTRFAIIASISLLLAGVVSVWIYSISAWLIVVPVVLCAVIVFYAFLQMAFGIEYLIHLGDTELLEFARKDGWVS